MKVTVYEKSGCPQCDATKRQLERLGVGYEVAALQDHLDVVAFAKQEGWTTAPVVLVEDGELLVDAWSGYRPDRIKALLQRRVERYGTEAQTG